MEYFKCDVSNYEEVQRVSKDIIEEVTYKVLKEFTCMSDFFYNNYYYFLYLKQSLVIQQYL